MSPVSRPALCRLAALVLALTWGHSAPAHANDRIDYTAFTAYARSAARPLASPLDIAGPQARARPSETVSHGLAEQLCTARVVALGEPTHGATQPLEFRNELLRALVERCGTRAVVLETGFTEAARLDRWIRSGIGDLETTLRDGLTWGFGAYPGNRELLIWMRHYNQLHHADPLHIYGMDIPGGDETDGLSRTRVVLDTIADFLERHAIAGLSRERATLRNVAAQFSLTQWGRQPATRHAALAQALTAIETRLRTSREGTSAQRAWIAQNIAVARRAAAMFEAWPRSPSPDGGLPAEAWRAAQIRDGAMADNVIWVTERAEQGSPVFVHAHVAHTMASKVRGSIWDSYAKPPKAMGLHLRRRLGARFQSIGISLGRGQAGSLDEALSDADAQRFVLDCQPRRAPDAARRWMTRPQVLHVNDDDSLRLIPCRAFDKLVHLPQ